VSPDRHAVAAGDVGVLDELPEDGLADGRLLGLPAGLERGVDVVGEVVVDLHAELLDRGRDLGHVELADCGRRGHGPFSSLADFSGGDGVLASPAAAN
jgi:hypothetical protein